MCKCDSRFLGKEWDRIFPQETLTIKFLRSSRMNPSLSAYAALFVAYNLNSALLAPPGTKVFIHLKRSQRGTFVPHGIDGWYIGPAMDTDDTKYGSLRQALSNT